MPLARIPIITAALTLTACSQIQTVRFGTVEGLHVTETRHIPYAVGTHYGFRVDFHNSGRPITLREEWHLPGPAHWKSAQEFVASAGGRIMTREDQLGSRTPDPPKIRSIYIEDLQIARGDPKGQYRVKLSLDDKAWKEFEFTIE
jgi:hypothetical protein